MFSEAFNPVAGRLENVGINWLGVEKKCLCRLSPTLCISSLNIFYSLDELLTELKPKWVIFHQHLVLKFAFYLQISWVVSYISRLH